MLNEMLLGIALLAGPAGVLLGYFLRHLDILGAHSPPDPLKKALKAAQASFKRQMEEKMLQQLGLAAPPVPPSPAAAGNTTVTPTSAAAIPPASAG